MRVEVLWIVCVGVPHALLSYVMHENCASVSGGIRRRSEADDSRAGGAGQGDLAVAQWERIESGAGRSDGRCLEGFPTVGAVEDSARFG